MAALPFKLDVDGIGDFMFREKSFRDQVKIESMASEILGRSIVNMRPDELGLAAVALGFAHLSVLTVDAPAGWDLEKLDPVEEESAEKVMQVYGRLKEELARFRRERSSGRAT
jgi:hypothetical protein